MSGRDYDSLEYNLSLPVAQQRILDGMADRLRRTEPKLAGMYAVFTRLCLNDGLPRREQLSRGRGPRTFASLVARLPGRETARGRRAWRLTLVASQLAIAIVLVAVLVVVAIRPASSCGQTAPHRPAADARSWCQAQTAANGSIGK